MAITDNLKAFWEFEEASGTREDATANNHDLTSYNSCARATGKVAYGIYANDSATSYLGCAHHADLSMGDIDWSACAWVNLNSASQIQPIVSKNGTVGEYVLYYDSDAAKFTCVVFQSNGTPAATAVATLPSPASTATWYFVVAGFDAANNRAFISVNNGTVYTGAQSAAPTTDTSASFLVGADTTSTIYGDLYIDQVGIWKKVLSSDEITWLYNSGNGRAYSEFSGGASNTDRQTVVGSGTFAGVAGTRMDLGMRPLTAAEIE